MRRWLGRIWPLLLLVILQGVFLVLPELDLWISELFYRPGRGFILADSVWPGRLEGLLTFLLVTGMVLLPWLWLSSAYWVGPGESDLRRRLVFLYLLLALIPLTLVWVLNDESGRAAPAVLTVFGGESLFSGAFQPAAECAADCAFVSQPASIGFALLAFAWVLRTPVAIRWGLAVGAVVGLVGLAAGTHHLSDVLFAFWPVYGGSLLLAWLLFGTTRIEGER